MTDEIIERARLIAGLDKADELLVLYAEEAVNYVLAYCHLEIMPQKLYALTARLAASAYKRGNDCDIVSLKEGDRQVDYGVFESVTRQFADRLRPFVDMRGRVPSEVYHV